MTRTISLLLPLLLAVPARAADRTLDAMRDELGRTMSSLAMPGMQKPYFASYLLSDSTDYAVSASFGELVDSRGDVSRNAAVEIRIGDRSFDSSGYAGSDFRSFRPVTGGTVIEDDYDAVRAGLWSLSDGAYKTALEKYAQKKAYSEKKGIKELYGDLSAEKKASRLEDVHPAPAFPKEDWERRARELSAVFRKYPGVQSSEVRVECTRRVNRFVNSEGTRYRVNADKAHFYVYAETQTGGGLKVSDRKELHWPACADIPAQEELLAAVDGFAGRLDALSRSAAGEVYLGPVLFENDAAAELIGQLFVRGISFPRRAWADNDDYLKYYIDKGGLVERVGMRVLPGFISVHDDPSRTEEAGRPLAGHYRVDSEGVAPGRLELVKNGRLAGVYMSRGPVRDFSSSNGHGRAALNEFPSGRPGNVFVSSRKTAPPVEIKKRLLELASEQELDYAVIVRRLASEGSLDIENILAAPVFAWKVYRDGREELMNGVEFTGVTYRALRDIVLTSDEPYIYNYYQPGPYAMARGSVAASIIAPSAVLVQEMELKRTDRKPDRAPYLEHPFFAENGGKK
ncbi:MAG: peptidase U62 modulator of DNA gyrase [Elusimicrobia bacterium]|nr:MAG: peptidase U62 modulator of DNA gyrase [Elusimicrobiota bacterium]KAF0157146.1 MAG: peptidase U62 modulator of DNA gyrase [Elusimicrobiota bacterium]